MTLAIVRELHQHYSEILYNPTRFKSTQYIMEYIIQTAEQHNRSVEPTMVPLASTVDITSVALPVALPVVLQVASQVASTEASTDPNGVSVCPVYAYVDGDDSKVLNSLCVEYKGKNIEYASCSDALNYETKENTLTDTDVMTQKWDKGTNSNGVKHSVIDSLLGNKNIANAGGKKTIWLMSDATVESIAPMPEFPTERLDHSRL